MYRKAHDHIELYRVQIWFIWVYLQKQDKWDELVDYWDDIIINALGGLSGLHSLALCWMYGSCIHYGGPLISIDIHQYPSLSIDDLYIH